MLDVNPMFALGLGETHNFVVSNDNLYSGLEPIDALFRKNQNSGAFSPSQFDFASNICSHQDETNGSDLIFRGSASNDLLNGTRGNDKLFGLAGDDLLLGRKGDDLLNGGTGNDRLLGHKGNDVLIDYDGGDIMTGGKGSDTFWLEVWGSPEYSSIITDFKVGTDKIKIGRLGATFDKLTIQDSDQGAVISDQDQILAIVSGVDAFRLTASNFVFGDPELTDKLQTALDNSVKESGTPGATQARITSDGFTWQGATGFSNVTQQTPMQPDDIFNIASVTKTFTAATVLKLAEEETLSLDDTLGKWLPEIAQNVPDGESITLRQLLNGSGGIPNPDYEQTISNLINNYFEFLNGSTRDVSPEESVASIYGKPRFSGQGSSPIWTYPNIGNVVAGLIVEKVTGSSFSSVMREQVLEPLGLERTFFGGVQQISGNVARGYEDIFTAGGSFGKDGVVEDYTDFNLSNPDSWAGATGLYSTAQDVARFSSALFGGELLNPDSLKQMLTFVDEGIPYEGNGYGLGVANSENSLEREWGKSGDTIGYNAQMRYFPDQHGATVVTLRNTNNLDPAFVANPNLITATTAI